MESKNNYKLALLKFHNYFEEFKLSIGKIKIIIIIREIFITVKIIKTNKWINQGLQVLHTNKELLAVAIKKYFGLMETKCDGMKCP